MVIDFVDFNYKFLVHQKLCNVIYKPGIELLLVKLTTEANQIFSLQKNFHVTGMCLNKGTFFQTKNLHVTIKP